MSKISVLNIRQKRFAEYYAQSGNTVQSAIQAGYSESYANGRAYELLEKVGIKNYIQELTDKIKDENIISAKDRLIILSKIAKNTDEKAGDRIKAIDTLNKMDGVYIIRDEAELIPPAINVNIIPATKEDVQDCEQ